MQWPVVASILAVGLAVRVVYLLQAADYPNFALPYAGLDAEMYRSLAQRVAAGDLALGDRPYYYCAPYAYWLGALYALFGDGPWVPRVANIAFGLGAVLLVHLITLRLFASHAAALAAALGAALYGPYLVFDTSAMKTSLGLFLTALALWSFLRALDRPRWTAWLGTGTAFGLAIWFVQPLLAVLALLLSWIVAGRMGAARLGSARQRLGGALVLLAGVALVLTPFFLRNLLVAGEPAPLTVIGGIHLISATSLGPTGPTSRCPRSGTTRWGIWWTPGGSPNGRWGTL